MTTYISRAMHVIAVEDKPPHRWPHAEERAPWSPPSSGCPHLPLSKPLPRPTPRHPFSLPSAAVMPRPSAALRSWRRRSRALVVSAPRPRRPRSDWSGRAHHPTTMTTKKKKKNRRTGARFLRWSPTGWCGEWVSRWGFRSLSVSSSSPSSITSRLSPRSTCPPGSHWSFPSSFLAPPFLGSAMGSFRRAGTLSGRARFLDGTRLAGIGPSSGSRSGVAERSRLDSTTKYEFFASFFNSFPPPFLSFATVFVLKLPLVLCL